MSEGRIASAIDALARRGRAAVARRAPRSRPQPQRVHHRGTPARNADGRPPARDAAVASTLDLATHDGVHPAPRRARRRAVRRAGRHPAPPRHRSGACLRDVVGERVPACPASSTTTPTRKRRDLPSVRRDAFVERAPDRGPSKPHLRLGATAVGARPPLVALNCVLDGGAVEDAQAIARAAPRTRRRDAGRACARLLAREPRPAAGVDEPRRPRTHRRGAGVRRGSRSWPRRAGRRLGEIELVGLMPAAELARCGPAVRAAAHLDDRRTIEGCRARVRARKDRS